MAPTTNSWRRKFHGSPSKNSGVHTKQKRKLFIILNYRSSVLLATHSPMTGLSDCELSLDSVSSVNLELSFFVWLVQAVLSSPLVQNGAFDDCTLASFHSVCHVAGCRFLILIDHHRLADRGARLRLPTFALIQLLRGDFSSQF